MAFPVWNVAFERTKVQYNNQTQLLIGYIREVHQLSLSVVLQNVTVLSNESFNTWCNAKQHQLKVCVTMRYSIKTIEQEKNVSANLMQN